MLCSFCSSFKIFEDGLVKFKTLPHLLHFQRISHLKTYSYNTGKFLLTCDFHGSTSSRTKRTRQLSDSCLNRQRFSALWYIDLSSLFSLSRPAHTFDIYGNIVGAVCRIKIELNKILRRISSPWIFCEKRYILYVKNRQSANIL